MKDRRSVPMSLVCSGVIAALLAQSRVLAAASDTGSADAAPVPASDSAGLQEIVVTATKSAESIDRVPISVSAYSKANMDDLGIRSIDDVSRLTPGINFEVTDPRSGSNISIRGISSTIGAGTTGIYIDDTPIQIRVIGYDAQNVFPSVFDLDRIEVLRGPQGTLFGAGSEGGTVRFITPQPNLDKDSMYTRAEVANTDGGGLSYEAGSAFGAPIVQDKAGFRVSAWYRRDGGWIDRVVPGTGSTLATDINVNETAVFRAALAFRPMDQLTITPAVFVQNKHSHDSSGYWNTLSNPSNGDYNTGDPLRAPQDDHFTLPSLQINYDAGAFTITSATSYFSRTAITGFDYSTVVPAVLTHSVYFGVPGYTSLTDYQDRQKNFTQELRIQSAPGSSGLRWLGGLFYSRAQQTAFEGIGGQQIDVLTEALFHSPAVDIFGPNVGPNGKYAYIGEDESVDRQIALFGDVNYTIGQWTGTAGLRVANTRFDYSNFQTGPFNTGTTGAHSSKTSTPVTPKAGLQFTVDEHNMVYASAAKGYRIGGGNAQLPVTLCAPELQSIGLTGAPQTFNSDSLWSYELGAKNRLFGDRLSLSSSLFYVDWKNIQQKVYLTQCAFQYIANLGGVTSKGFDLQAELAITSHLSLDTAVGYQHARYNQTTVPGPNAQPGGPNSVLVSAGDTVSGPPWTVTMDARYEHSLWSGAQGYGIATYIFHSHNNARSPFLDPQSVSYDPGLPNVPQLTLLNLRAGVRVNNWDVSLFANNVLNADTTILYAHDVPGDPLYKNLSTKPRTVGATLIYSF